MKRKAALLLLIAACVFLSSGVLAAAGPKKGVTRGELNGMKYLLNVPGSYNQARGTGLLVVLHGAGGSIDGFFGDWTSFGQFKNWLVLAPEAMQNGSYGDDPNDTKLISGILADLKKTYNITEMMALGYSRGGFQSFQVAFANPLDFTGVFCLCGGLSTPTASKNEWSKMMSVYIYHCADDGAVPIATARKTKKALEEAGYKYLRYEEMPSGGHIYNTRKILEACKWIDENKTEQANDFLKMWDDKANVGPGFLYKKLLWTMPAIREAKVGKAVKEALAAIDAKAGTLVAELEAKKDDESAVPGAWVGPFEDGRADYTGCPSFDKFAYGVDRLRLKHAGKAKSLAKSARKYVKSKKHYKAAEKYWALLEEYYLAPEAEDAKKGLAELLADSDAADAVYSEAWAATEKEVDKLLGKDKIDEALFALMKYLRRCPESPHAAAANEKLNDIGKR